MRCVLLQGVDSVEVAETSVLLFVVNNYVEFILGQAATIPSWIGMVSSGRHAKHSVRCAALKLILEARLSQSVEYLICFLVLRVQVGSIWQFLRRGRCTGVVLPIYLVLLLHFVLCRVFVQSQ
jgi:hypothetical protein